MCKAMEYLKQLEDISNKVHEDYKYYYLQQIKYNNIQQDMLHLIENLDGDLLTNEEKIKIFDTFKKMREERRKNKNELRMLQSLDDKFYFETKKELINLNIKENKECINWKYFYKSDFFKNLNKQMYYTPLNIQKQKFYKKEVEQCKALMITPKYNL